MPWDFLLLSLLHLFPITNHVRAPVTLDMPARRAEERRDVQRRAGGLRQLDEYQVRANTVSPCPRFVTSCALPSSRTCPSRVPCHACARAWHRSLRGVICTSRDGDRFWKLPEVVIRGNNIKYLRIPEDIIGMVPEEDLSAKGGGFGGKGGGRGDGRGKGGGKGGKGDGGKGGRGKGGGRGDGRGAGRAAGRGHS